MAVVTMWMVRAGEGAFLFEASERLSIVGNGGGELGPLCGLRPSGDVVRPAGRPHSDVSGPSNATSSGQDYWLVPTMRDCGAVLTSKVAGRLPRRNRRRRPHAGPGHDRRAAQCRERQLARACPSRSALAREPKRSRSMCIRAGAWTRMLSSGGRGKNLGGRTRKPKALVAARV